MGVATTSPSQIFKRKELQLYFGRGCVLLVSQRAMCAYQIKSLQKLKEPLNVVCRVVLRQVWFWCSSRWRHSTELRTLVCPGQNENPCCIS